MWQMTTLNELYLTKTLLKEFNILMSTKQVTRCHIMLMRPSGVGF